MKYIQTNIILNTHTKIKCVISKKTKNKNKIHFITKNKTSLSTNPKWHFCAVDSAFIFFPVNQTLTFGFIFYFKRRFVEVSHDPFLKIMPW